MTGYERTKRIGCAELLPSLVTFIDLEIRGYQGSRSKQSGSLTLSQFATNSKSSHTYKSSLGLLDSETGPFE